MVLAVVALAIANVSLEPSAYQYAVVPQALLGERRRKSATSQIMANLVLLMKSATLSA